MIFRIHETASITENRLGAHTTTLCCMRKAMEKNVAMISDFPVPRKPDIHPTENVGEHPIAEKN